MESKIKLLLFKARVWVLATTVFFLSSCQKEHEDAPNHSESGKPLFRRVNSESSGITFSNAISENLLANILNYEYFYNGGGVAAGDLNNDGLPDIYFTGNQVKNKLYLNKGNLQFEDISEKAGVTGKGGWSTGVTMADVNGDGYLDIYVCKSGKYKPEDRKNELYINNRDLTFTESAAKYGLDDPAYSTQALFLDYDRDNNLDMFLLNHSIRLFPGYDALVLNRQTDPYAGDKLFRNENGKFTDVSVEAGIHQNPLGYGLGVTAGDLNKDGWPDIYVTNDYVEPDYLYLNNGDGTFSEKIKEATGHISNFGMGVDIADINNDTWPDIFVADMVAEDNYRQKTNMAAMAPEKFYQAVKYGFHYQYMFNTLQLNNQNMSFSEIGQMAGVSNTDWSWATLLMDFNNDGYRDLLVTNGFRKEFANKDYVNFRNTVIDSVKNKDKQSRLKALKMLLDELPEHKIPNYIFENQENLSFAKKNQEWGMDIPSFSNGATATDLDNDGDLDILINNIDHQAFLFENLSEQQSYKANYLKIKFNGPRGNHSGIGARIYLQNGELKHCYEHYLTRGYQSSVESVVHIGLGNIENVDSMAVIWPDGKTEILRDTGANQTITLNYGDADAPKIPEKEAAAPLFADITDHAELDYAHQENDYYDFENEILLPHKMSQFGPALAADDVNGDGLEDVFLGGAATFPGKLFLQHANGRFSPAQSQPWENDALSEDVGAAFFDADNDNDPDLYVVSGGNEFPAGSHRLQDRLYLNDGKGNFSKDTQALPALVESGSVARPFDFDRDGDLDLFVGGRLVPRKYPAPANSRLLLNHDGSFRDVTGQYFPDALNLGMVTDARWTDINSNGKPDLVVVGEWMPIAVFEYNNDRFEDITETLGLSQYTGWWYSVAAEDLDQDGDMDLVAGNLGLNYKYKASPTQPFQVYYDDFDNNGTGDIVLGYFNQGELYPLRGRQCSSEQMPFIKEKFPSYHDFGLATLPEVYGKKALNNALHYTANTFATSIFINDDNQSFTEKPLPAMAQISSVNSILVEDFDQDEISDLLIAGNLYPVEIETIRNDASIGLFLKGKGNLNFEPFNVTRSGFYAPGDVKRMQKIALADGSVGIVIAKNSDRAQLIKVNDHNVRLGNLLLERTALKQQKPFSEAFIGWPVRKQSRRISNLQTLQAINDAPGLQKWPIGGFCCLLKQFKIK